MDLNPILRALLPSLPLILVHVVAIVLGLVMLSRHLKRGLCVVFAGVLGLSLPIFWALATALLVNSVDLGEPDYREQVDRRLVLVQVMGSCLSASAWGLLLVAAFAWRTPAHAHVHVVSPAGTSLSDVPLPTVRPASKLLYMGIIIVSGALLLALSLAGAGMLNSVRRDDRTIGAFLLAGAMIPMIVEMVVMAVLLYRMWAAIQGGSPRTTPGKAVGFLFIPLFNFYWVFQAYYGWSVDYNRFIAAHGIPALRAPQGITLAMCILTLLAMVPVIGLVFGLINIILFIVFINAGIDGINSIAAASSAQQHRSAAPAV